ncbi:MAG: hypothetical protein AAF125_09790 [Chloroflexota bacterium]
MKRLSTAILALVLAACSTTPTTPSAPASSFLPSGGEFDDYAITEAESITDAITAAAGDGAAALDNPAIQQAVAAVDGFIDCYSAIDAVAANIYTQVNLADILRNQTLLPKLGTVAVVNQDAVAENFVACATGASGFTAQSATEVCQGSGSFQSAGDTLRYIYISTDQNFCSATEAHFAGLS